MMKTAKLVSYLCLLYMSASLAAGEQRATTIPVKVGVVLDAETFLGKMGLSCLHMALSDFYASHSHYKTRLLLHIMDSKSDLIQAASAAVHLIKNERVQAIIGPQDSRQANFVIDLGNKAHVPIISFSTTSPSLTYHKNPYFFRAAQSDSAQVQALLSIFQAFQWNQVVPIYMQGIYAEEIMPSVTKALQEANVHVPYQSAISPSATDQQIVEELRKLREISNRVFIVHMSILMGSRLFLKAEEMGMMKDGYAWILTTEMANLLSSMNSSVLQSMQGVIGVSAYFPKTREVQDFEARWKVKFQQENPSIIGAQMNVFGLWAYDSATALAMAVEKAGTEDLSFQTVASTPSNLTDCEALGISENGPRLVDVISKTKFKGLAGEFSLLGGELDSLIFQIINVFGDGKRTVGFWTPQNGLRRELSNNMAPNSNFEANIRPIIWPGDSSSAPRGRDVQAYVKKLRVGIPVKPKSGFTELVNVEHDPRTNTANVSGYCVDIFKVVMEALLYDVPYEFIPFYRSDYDHTSLRPYYDALIQQVYLGEFDAAVGDITIRADRSLHVDFTLPFTQNGATFMVPTKDENKKNAWIFLKPLTWELWLTIGCFFVFIAFVVWLLEHRINAEFRGSPSNQVGTSFWFSFSTLVFAQRERINSNWTRFVVIIWVFVVLILTQSYTASLTTLLTVQQLRPAVTDVSQLIQNGDYVGYQFNFSYTFELLKQLGFDESKLRVYSSPEECDQLLTIGSENGGIAAAFGEIPYIDIIQARHCSKYTTIGPTYRTEGFGFAFRRDSPLVPDVSRAIINLTDGNRDIVKQIEHKWFKNETLCPQHSAVDVSYSLDLDSFRGLFLVAGIASSSALIIHVATFIYGNRHVMMQFDPEDSWWKRICDLLRIFDQKDFRFHGSENNRECVNRIANKAHDIAVTDTSTDSHSNM